MDIGGRWAVVTGGASGIGRATARRLADRGAGRITLVDIDNARLVQAAEELGQGRVQVDAKQLDMGDLAAVESWFRALCADGAPDILHNNAGMVSGAQMFPEMDVARLQRMVDVNLTAVMIATQTVAQGMRAHVGGAIVNTVSTVALGTAFRDTLYATTKAGLMMFTRCCAPLAAEWGVRVTGVLPGLTDTPILHTTGGDRAADWMAPVLANNERCTPEDIAAAVIDLIEDDGIAGGDWVAVRRIGGEVVRQWGHDTPV